MNFSEILNKYIELLNCSSKDLADISNISSAAISRYRNGDRIPSFDSPQFSKLITGIEKMAIQKNIDGINQDILRKDFSSVYGKNITDFNLLRKNINILIYRP